MAGKQDARATLRALYERLVAAVRVESLVPSRYIDPLALVWQRVEMDGKVTRDVLCILESQLQQFAICQPRGRTDYRAAYFEVAEQVGDLIATMEVSVKLRRPRRKRAA